MSTATRTRPSHTPTSSVATISSFRDFERPASQATAVSDPSSLSHSPSPGAKRPSISTTMHWLSRNPNHNSTISSSPPNSSSPYAAQKPVRISEPKFIRGMDTLTQQRSGVLGAGATIVRTPDEALRDIASRSKLESSDDPLTLAPAPAPKTLTKHRRKKSSISKTIVPPSPESVGAASLYSPPLPPLPSSESEEDLLTSRSSSRNSKARTPQIPAAVPTAVRTSSNAPIPVPRSPSLRPSLKIRSVLSSEEKDIVPPLPSSVPPSPPPPFRAILVSDPPAFPVDSERVIVTLETCTQTYRTTLATINSRPSHLSRYVDSILFPKRLESSASSVYSTPDDEEVDEDMTIYRKHLASQGLIPQTSHNVHLFLDRPSAPYAHILTYLRSSPPTPENPEVIPRAVLYQPSQPVRLESLIELRDEASYLALESLHKMCVDEIMRMRQHQQQSAPKMHTRGNSASGLPSTNTIQSLRASVYTLHTLLERVETDVRSSAASLPVPELMRGSSSLPSVKETSWKDNAVSDPAPGAMRLPPTPPSWENGHRRNGSMQRPVKPAPVGWI